MPVCYAGDAGKSKNHTVDTTCIHPEMEKGRSKSRNVACVFCSALYFQNGLDFSCSMVRSEALGGRTDGNGRAFVRRRRRDESAAGAGPAPTL